MIADPVTDKVVFVKRDGTGDYRSVKDALVDRDTNRGCYIIDVQDGNMYAEHLVIDGSAGAANYVVIRANAPGRGATSGIPFDLPVLSTGDPSKRS